MNICIFFVWLICNVESLTSAINIVNSISQDKRTKKWAYGMVDTTPSTHQFANKSPNWMTMIIDLEIANDKIQVDPISCSTITYNRFHIFESKAADNPV